MSPDNKKKLWQEVLKAGDILKGKLPPSPNHPRGRNSYAHVASCIKSKFGLSYTKLHDDKYEEVMKYISFLTKNSH
tara:strand:+ start:120 stop:347 length:228 start_codon:yes stop_codon:yes gene_type:complete